MVEHCSYSCGTTIILFYTLYIGIAILYKLVLHGIGLFLAFKTRKVQIDIINDYKYVVVTSTVCCSTVVMLMICVILPLTMKKSTISSLSWSCLVFPLICIYLGLTFIHKVWKLMVKVDNNYVHQFIALYKDPDGKKIFRKSENRTATENWPIEPKTLHETIS